MCCVIMHLFRDLLNIIYPNLCCGCSDVLTQNEELICFRCKSQLPKIDNGNLTENEVTDRTIGKFDPVFAAAYLYFYKDGITQRLLHQLKYKHKPQ